MRPKRLAALLLAALLTAALLRPSQARADTLTTSLIVSAGITGAIALVYFSAIVMAGHDDEVEFLREPAGRASRGPAFATACRPVEGRPVLFCW